MWRTLFIIPLVAAAIVLLFLIASSAWRLIRTALGKKVEGKDHSRV